MTNQPRKPLSIENSYFLRIKDSGVYVHFRYRKYIYKPTLSGACMFENDFADEFIKAENTYELEKVAVKDALIQ